MVEDDSWNDAPLWGIAAEFGTADAALEAARSLRSRAFGRVDISSPVPLTGVVEALELPAPGRLHAIIGAAAGFVFMMGLCLYTTGFDYVLNIGGRPRLSWLSFVIPSFSTAMLTGTLTVFVAMLIQDRLPRLNHPAFNIDGFERGSQDRFFLIVQATRTDFDVGLVSEALLHLAKRPIHVSVVPR